MGILLSRDAILSTPVPTSEVEVPEWGGAVMVRSMTHLDRIELLDVINIRAIDVENYEVDQRLPEDEREGLPKVEQYDESLLRVLYSIVDDDGKRLFCIDDYELFRTLNYPTLKRIYAAIMTMENQQTPIDRVALKKNSGTTRVGGSTSGSPRR